MEDTKAEMPTDWIYGKVKERLEKEGRLKSIDHEPLTNEHETTPPMESAGTAPEAEGAERYSLPEEEKKKDVGEREIENIVVDTSKTPLPDSRNAALDAVSKLKRPFINEDQNKEIIVSNTSVRHSSTQDHGFVDVRCMGIIDRIIRKAVKIGEIPVDENEQGHTHKIEVYYCPVNIDGSQHSARLVVKQYENRGCVLEDFQLYDLHARQEKTGAS